MFAIRRFRGFLAVALLLAASVYYLSGRTSWGYSQPDRLVQSPLEAAKPADQEPVAYPPSPGYKRPPPLPVHEESSSSSRTTSTSSSTIVPIQKPKTRVAVAPTSTKPAAPKVTKSTFTQPDASPKKPTPPEKVDNEGEGSGRQEVSANLAKGPRARWQKPTIHNPVAKEDLISLPTGAGKKLPKIQATFTPETAAARKDRIGKLNTIKESFKHAWKGYKQYGLPHDEVQPISKLHRDPFMGWGATLVDTLDTLWIMNLKEEFEEAVAEVAKIDFKTSARKDIPLFETVIRYLGGLLGAYDMTNGKYPVLLNKTEELAEILIGAFDTPNRMPMTFYNWAPSYTSQSHRAATHATMAELGSLSVEFTRLAQITGNQEYYDAIARVTNEFEKWQPDTLIPGLWPLKVDASGCKKVELKSSVNDQDIQRPVLDDEVEFDGVELPGYEEDIVIEPKGADEETDLDKRDTLAARARPAGRPSRARPRPPQRRPPTGPFVKVDQEILAVDCEKQGLAPVPNARVQSFGIGGQADSTYEYLPKMYALLRGRSDQYKDMYLKAAKAIREQLLFRPMIKDQDRRILFSAKRDLNPKSADPMMQDIHSYEVTHLTCFMGGMFGLGAKLFDLKDDLRIAKELTDGCVWAYESMPTGVMAEVAGVVPCPGMEPCAWNQTRWLEALDPYQAIRFAQVEVWNKKQREIYEKSHQAALEAASKSVSDDLFDDEIFDEEPVGKRRKRTEELAVPQQPPSKTLPKLEEELSIPGKSETEEGLIRFVPKVALAHDKFVAARITEERLPSSYTSIFDRHYGLRPEAIESVFYMYRLTGEEIWREKGWKMFEAVQTATQTDTANAGLSDVTSNLGELEDVMESFWLAETLKYFYLLFDEPERVSLDEWVFNTEAHPLAIR